MAIKIGANFAYNGKLPNFDRDKFKTKAAMMAFDENNIEEGHLSYCEEDGNTYQFKSTNTVDATTGKWRPFKTEADATLNGTSINPIQNKAVFEALKLKADAAALDAYQPKYKAAFVFDKDYKYSEFQVYYGTVDLNGYTLSIDSATSVSNNFLNGTIMVETNGVDFNGNLAINCIIHSNNDAFNIRLIDTLFYNCSINHAVFSGAPEFHNCVLDYCTSGDGNPIIRNSIINFPKITGTIDFPLYNVIIDDVVYKQAIIENGKFVEAGYVSDIYASNVAASNAPSCEAVKTALQLKADKTQLNGLATKTELNGKADASALNNYVTTATANTTYAKKSDISNVYKFKGTKTNYADLPTTNRVTGDVWNITNADAEHGIKVGDNVAWNGTAWDNLSGTVDLSAYATKEKAFTKDTVSTEPGQFVAGPINTRGNISLRKIDISDIPDLRSKYQKLDGNGYQEKAKVAGLIVKHGNTGDTGSGYLIAEVDQAVGGQMGPDWYYATDGTLQDIKTKIPKVVLDDTVSTTSDNGVKNSVITKYVDGKVTTINDSIANVRTSLESTQTDFVDLRNKVNAMPKTVILTQAAYNALTTKDPNTIYYING